MRERWEIKTLGEVLQKTSTVDPRQDPEAKFEYIDVSSVSNSTFQIEETQRLKGKDAPSRARRLVRANDVLFATVRPTLQRIAVVPEPLDGQVCSTGYIVLRPKAEIDYRFMFYSLFTEDFVGQMESLQKGASYPAVTDSEVKSQRIPVPPLPEQQRIVGILDEAFEGIATAKANAEKNLQNARGLFESHLQSVFTQGGEGWVEKRLGDVCELHQGLCINAKTKHLLVEKSSLPLLRIKDLRENSVEQYVAESGWPENARVTESEIIYTRTGQIGLVFRGRVGVLHNNCFKVRPSAALNEGYLFWWLQNPGFRARITVLASKAAQPDITHSLFKAQPIMVPPRAYQDQAIALIEDAHHKTQRLASLYQRKRTALDELKKSLLHQAFSGQL